MAGEERVLFARATSVKFATECFNPGTAESLDLAVYFPRTIPNHLEQASDSSNNEYNQATET